MGGELRRCRTSHAIPPFVVTSARCPWVSSQLEEEDVIRVATGFYALYSKGNHCRSNGANFTRVGVAELLSLFFRQALEHDSFRLMLRQYGTAAQMLRCQLASCISYACL